jgi:histone-binding protein RBBP4
MNTLSGVQVTDFEAGLTALTNAHLIKEEYRAWKKNVPFLYDTIINHTLDQVSLSVEWFTDQTINAEKNYVAHRLLMGTQANTDAQNAIVINEVRLPIQQKQQQDGQRNPKLQNSGKVEAIQKIAHDGDVNRARYMPQNPNIIATKSSNKDLYIFDRTRHSTNAAKEATPQLRLVGHNNEGYGLSWDPRNLGRVVSGSADKKILMWDIERSGVVGTNSSTDKTSSVNPIQELKAINGTSGEQVGQAASTGTQPSNPAQPGSKAPTYHPIVSLLGHDDIVEDVCHHPVNDSMVLSCGDDKLVCVWDLRQGGEPLFKVKGHKAEVNSVSINPHDPFIFASGSSDFSVAMWDIRNLTQKLHSFEHHTDQVFAVQWSPFAENILSSSSTDRRVLIWDILQIGSEQQDDETEDGPPELVFMHCGHTDKVNDIAWSYSQDWLMASVADNEVLQIWEVAKAVRDEYDEDADDEEISDEDLE